MVFDYKEIYYYFRTSKYEQILTNKSHRHEILKSSFIQRIAVCTYTQEIVFFINWNQLLDDFIRRDDVMTCL